MMRITFLGTGTSTGVPQLGCTCKTCRSNDNRDKRLRASVLLTTSSQKNILIDCGPDFYHQMLASETSRIDALLLTHIHYDHVGGIDDLRPYCQGSKGFPVYCTVDVENDLKQRLPYCFDTNPYPGVPHFKFHTLQPYVPFEVCGENCTPLTVMHYRLPIVAFKFDQVAYVTDCKTMPEQTVEELKGIDTLIINSLRIAPHLSHMSLSETLDVISKINPRRAYLTHLSHQMGCHQDVEKMLPQNVFIAYDGLTIP